MKSPRKQVRLPTDKADTRDRTNRTIAWQQTLVHELRTKETFGPNQE